MKLPPLDRKIVILGSDHAGYPLKSELSRRLQVRGATVIDLGVETPLPAGYAPVAHEVAQKVLESGGVGVLVCGTGIGMSIAANRVKGIRAALCNDSEFARLARSHNDANVLVLPGRFMETDDAEAVLETFLNTSFEGERHVERVRAIDKPRGKPE